MLLQGCAIVLILVIEQQDYFHYRQSFEWFRIIVSYYMQSVIAHEYDNQI